MSKKKDDETPADGEEAPKGKKKLLIIVLAAVLVLGGGAYFFRQRADTGGGLGGAVGGVAVARALAVRERHRESTTLRALGLSRAQAVASIGVESALLGLAGVVIGTGLGVLFGVLAVVVLQERAVVPVGTLLLSAVALVAVAALAGTLPAVAAARRPPIPVGD